MYLVWVLSLPAWPSQDGPVHLYYTAVLGQLLQTAHVPTAHFFTIKHLLPPYALYYYLLLALSHAVPLLLADRLIICAYLVLFLTGFHALARAAAPSNPRGADRATLLATLLLLNWPLGMGFVNYCLSLSLALWALAVWFRRDGGALRRSLLFFFLLIVVTLAHPVPLLIVLGLGALDLCVRWAQRQRQPYPACRRDAVTLACGALPLLYVRAFAASHLMAQRTADTGPVPRALARVAGYAQGKSLSLLFGHTLGVTTYRAALVLTLLVALGAALQQALRPRLQQGVRTTDLFLAAALGLLILLPWLPSDISGAYFFPERLILLVWIFALIAAAGWQAQASVVSRVSRQRHVLTTAGFLLLAVLANAALLFSAEIALRPLGQQALALERDTSVHSGELVLALESSHLPPVPRVAPSWNPYYWMAVHTLRAQGAVLANAPWLDSSIIPLAAQPTLPAASLSPQLANSPHALGLALQTQPLLAQKMLPLVDAILFTPASEQPATQPDNLLLSTEPAVDWLCGKNSGGVVQVCRPLHREEQPDPSR